jgi:hypothetical protein
MSKRRDLTFDRDMEKLNEALTRQDALTYSIYVEKTGVTDFDYDLYERGLVDRGIGIDKSKPEQRSLSYDLNNAVSIAYRPFAPLGKGESVSRVEYERRLRELKKAGVPVRFGKRMKKFQLEREFYRVRMELGEEARKSGVDITRHVE